MKEKLFLKKKKTCPALLELCIDAIILSKDTGLFREIYYLPDCLLRKVDSRYFQMEFTKEYKKRFKSLSF